MNKNIFKIAAILILSLALISIANAQSISGLTANPAAFNPGTGSTTIGYTLNDVTNGHVFLNIRDSANNPVRSIDGGIQSSGTHSIVWDGKNNNGNIVPESNYLADISLSTGSGNYEFKLKWGSSGSGDGQFNSPIGVAVDSDGNVYVADGYNSRIQKFDSNGVFITKWGNYGSGDGQFIQPFGVAVDSSGYVYVLEYGNHRIQKFTSDGIFIKKWGSSGSGDGQFQYPSFGVGFDSAGNVYVADTNNNRIQKFTSDGVFIKKWGSFGTGNGQFDWPRGIAVDSLGNVYVTDGNNHRIQKFTSDGVFITKWGSIGTGNGQFIFPFGVAVDSGGNVYVVDDYYTTKFDSNGVFITKWGGAGSGDGLFKYPRGIAVDSTGNVYVGDTGNHRIQKFAQSIATVISAQTNIIVDTTAPSITAPIDVTVEATALPMPVTLVPATATDLNGIVSITNDAPPEGFPLGDTTVTWTATDGSGLKATATQKVTIVNTAPIDTASPITSNVNLYPSPAAVNSVITLNTMVSDATTGGSLISSAEYSIDNAGFVGMIANDNAFDEVSEDVTANLGSFTNPGVHNICVQATDSAGNIGNQECTLLPIYDPTGGFVTGGGWINSPKGAYLVNPDMTGKANFGFVSKYQVGAKIPIGETEFQFKTGNLNFHSTVYDWLVVAGAKAQYKGSGTVNGAGDYGFLLTATDGQMNGGGGVDKFRIKIVDKSTGTVVYDNVRGISDEMDTANPQAIGGGSIVIHNK